MNPLGRKADRIIIRLERAGGELSEAAQLLAGTGPHADLIKLGKSIRNVNIMVADLRAAIVRLQNGDDFADIMRDLESKWADLWPV